jgi:hypothetical protein
MYEDENYFKLNIKASRWGSSQKSELLEDSFAFSFVSWLLACVAYVSYALTYV